jgi:C4-dicarboxylate-specific signal transduction histidine kinase
MDFTANPDTVRCVSSRLQLVFLNIFSNAVFAVKKKGDRETGKIRIVTMNDESKENIIIRFIDNGIGIPEKDIKKIFDPFFTAYDSEEKAGLGLSVSYNIVKQLKGDIRAQCRKNETMIEVTLPVYRE